MSDLVTVGNYLNRFSAEVAQGVLEVGGIESFVRADDAGGMRPALLTGAGGAWLTVRAEDAARARLLLQAARHEEADS